MATSRRTPWCGGRAVVEMHDTGRSCAAIGHAKPSGRAERLIPRTRYAERLNSLHSRSGWPVAKRQPGDARTLAGLTATWTDPSERLWFCPSHCRSLYPTVQ